jgi:hypothetical protein
MTMPGAEQFVVVMKRLEWLWSEGTASSSLKSPINQINWEESDEHRQAVTNHQGDGVAGLSGYLSERKSCWY